MCENCADLKYAFEIGKQKPHEEYSSILGLLKEYENQQKIELIAGDCDIDEVDQHLASELHFTICHYFRCRSCGIYFLIGACIRGAPIFKILESLEEEKIKK